MISPLLPFQDEFPGIVQAVHIPPAETPEFFTQGKRRPVFPDQALAWRRISRPTGLLQ